MWKETVKASGFGWESLFCWGRSFYFGMGWMFDRQGIAQPRVEAFVCFLESNVTHQQTLPRVERIHFFGKFLPPCKFSQHVFLLEIELL